VREKIAFFLLLAAALWTEKSSAQSEIYWFAHSGSYLDKISQDPEMHLNIGLGYQHFLSERVAVSLGVRWLLYLAGTDDINYKNSNKPDGTSTEFRDTYTATAVDYEAIYFFDNYDDNSWYFSSGISLQMMKCKIEVFDSYDFNLGSTSTLIPIGDYEHTINFYPLSFRLGKHYVRDSFYLDWFIGYSVNLGAGGTDDRPYAYYLNYDQVSSGTIIFGFKSGITF